MDTLKLVQQEIARLEQEQKLVGKRLVKLRELAATFAAPGSKPVINSAKKPDAVAVPANAQ